jgi:hypothetical protein
VSDKTHTHEATKELAWMLLAGLTTIAATIVTRKILTVGWKFVTGNNPPDSPDNPDLGTTEAVTWALASGVGIAVARLFATRKAAKAFQWATGDLPPGMSREAVEKI